MEYKRSRERWHVEGNTGIIRQLGCNDSINPVSKIVLLPPMFNVYFLKSLIFISKKTRQTKVWKSKKEQRQRTG